MKGRERGANKLVVAFQLGRLVAAIFVRAVVVAVLSGLCRVVLVGAETTFSLGDVLRFLDLSGGSSRCRSGVTLRKSSLLSGPRHDGREAILSSRILVLA